MSDERGAVVDLLLAARDVYADRGGGAGHDAFDESPFCVLGAFREATGRDDVTYSTLEDDYLAAMTALDQAGSHLRTLMDNGDVITRIFDRNDVIIFEQPKMDRGGPSPVILDLYDDAIRWAKENTGPTL